MELVCQSCRKSISLSQGSQPGRRDTCPHCSTDLHSCLNCRHYDRSAYRECRENVPELVKDKDRANFCDAYQAGSPSGISTNNVNDLLKAADALFKKK